MEHCLKRLPFLLLFLPGTFPLDSTKNFSTPLKLAFGSCHKLSNLSSDLPPPDLLAVIASKSPSAFLWLGDSTYPPANPSPSSQLSSFAALNALPSYQALRKATNNNIFATWDDHDYGENDAGSTLPDKELRAQQFKQFYGIDDDGREGVYNSHIFEGSGGVKVKVRRTQSSPGSTAGESDRDRRDATESKRCVKTTCQSDLSATG